MRKIVIIFIVFILNANYVFAGMIVGDTPTNGCNYLTDLYAVFEPNQYTCAAGEYLPANHDGCEPCLSGATCVGGTFTFSRYFAKGIVYTNNVTTDAGYGCQAFDARMTAVFEPNRYTCSPGEYLPANAITCTTCPQNHYCVGGTYTFNETTAQGKVTCNTGLFSPAGSSEPELCGRILHVGDSYVYLRSTKLTAPSLHLDIDQDGIPDFFGNMTRTSVAMNKDFENLPNNNSLVIEIKEPFIDRSGRTIHAGKYYVYDSTITVPQE